MLRDSSLNGASDTAQTSERLGDFTTTPRVITMSALAIVIGVVGAFVALVLLRLIGLFTNLFFSTAGIPHSSLRQATH